MRKDRVYKLKMSLSRDTCDIQQAECGCPAGMGRHGSYKHIASVAYAIVDFCQINKSVVEHGTCSDRLQQWNKPRWKVFDPIAVENLG